MLTANLPVPVSCTACRVRKYRIFFLIIISSISIQALGITHYLAMTLVGHRLVLFELFWASGVPRTLKLFLVAQCPFKAMANTLKVKMQSRETMSKLCCTRRKHNFMQLCREIGEEERPSKFETRYRIRPYATTLEPPRELHTFDDFRKRQEG